MPYSLSDLLKSESVDYRGGVAQTNNLFTQFKF